MIARLGSAVAYHSRATDDIDRKIIEHVRDYGEVNNRTIQRLFDVDVYRLGTSSETSSGESC
ncbi:hypothetical protein ACQEUU_28910 [Nonomuraea sp. CA-218870]|uniref:hypothetical protein n=1 Tax=Nonomuraea sp. CA-218870 TaxID=3239998 RepID=UPI003D8DC852